MDLRFGILEKKMVLYQNSNLIYDLQAVQCYQMSYEFESGKSLLRIEIKREQSGVL